MAFIRLSSVPDLEGYKYHAFITYSSADCDFAEEVDKNLRVAGFSVLLAERDFLAGNLIVDEINRAVKTCRRVIMIMSPDYFKSNWCQYEAVVSTERTILEGKIVNLPILYRMSKSEIPERFKWLNYLDYENERGRFWERLYKTLSEADVHIHNAMPVGNVGTGLAWNYFYGYLNFLMEHLVAEVDLFTTRLINKDHVERVKDSQWWDADPEKRRMSQKLFIIIPLSCFCHKTFHNADSSIDRAGELPEFKRTRAGVYQRSYTTPVHKVTAKDDEVYYFAGEYATPIQSIYEMEAGGIAGLRAEHKEAQVIIFYHTLQNILNHAVAHHCHNKFYIHLYNDSPHAADYVPLGETLVRLLKQEIAMEGKRELSAQMRDISLKK